MHRPRCPYLRDDQLTCSCGFLVLLPDDLRIHEETARRKWGRLRVLWHRLRRGLRRHPERRGCYVVADAELLE